MEKLKFITVLSLIVGSLAFGTYDTDTAGNAKVTRSEGVYVFMDCEPLTEYDIVFTHKVKIVWSNSQINDVPDLKETVIKRVKKKALRNGQTFDAIIVKSLTDITAIKFKEEAKE